MRRVRLSRRRRLAQARRETEGQRREVADAPPAHSSNLTATSQATEAGEGRAGRSQQAGCGRKKTRSRASPEALAPNGRAELPDKEEAQEARRRRDSDESASPARDAEPARATVAKVPVGWLVG